MSLGCIKGMWLVPPWHALSQLNSQSLALRVLLAVGIAIGTVLGNQSMAADTEAFASPLTSAPRTSGPVLGVPLPCEPTSEPEPMGSNAQLCSWDYTFLGETKANKDFAVRWLKMEVHPGKGMCVRKLRFRKQMAHGIRIVSATPAAPQEISTPTSVLLRLVVDAGGSATIGGTVEQRAFLDKGRIAIRRNPGVYEISWYGRSPKRIVIPVGMELSYRPEQRMELHSLAEVFSFKAMACEVPSPGIKKR